MKRRMRNTQAVLRRARRNMKPAGTSNTVAAMTQTLQQHEARLFLVATLCAKEFGEADTRTQRARAAFLAILEVMMAMEVSPAWELPDNAAAREIRDAQHIVK